MRVIHIFNELKYSGAEIMYANAASLFQEQGVEMIALSMGEQIGDFLPRFKAENIEVHYKKLSLTEYNPFVLVPFFLNMYQFVRQYQIDVIHIHRSKHSWWFSLIGYIAGVKTIRTVHNVFKHRKLTWIKGFLERYTARKLFKTTFQTIGKSVHDNELYYYKNKSVVVNNWYDGGKFYLTKSLSEKQELRNSLSIPKDATVIVSTGGCSPIKNHHDIIEALQLVNEKIECFYLHLGHGKTEKEEQELARSLGVYEKVCFLGNQKNVRDYLIASDVYVMPSRFEGLSIAAIEAMACGLPSVLYNAPGLRDLIHNDDNGLLIEPNPKALAKAVLELNENAHLRETMGNKAHQFVSHNFSVLNGVKGIMKLYLK